MYPDSHSEDMHNWPTSCLSITIFETSLHLVIYSTIILLMYTCEPFLNLNVPWETNWPSRCHFCALVQYRCM